MSRGLGDVYKRQLSLSLSLSLSLGTLSLSFSLSRHPLSLSLATPSLSLSLSRLARSLFASSAQLKKSQGGLGNQISERKENILPGVPDQIPRLDIAGIMRLSKRVSKLKVIFILADSLARPHHAGSRRSLFLLSSTLALMKMGGERARAFWRARGQCWS